MPTKRFFPSAVELPAGCRTKLSRWPKAPSVQPPAVLFLLMFLFSLPAWAANPVPFVNQPVVPGAVPPGGAQFTLTVNGTGFVTGSVVNWNGSALTTTYVSAAQLTAVVPAANIVLPGTALITVTNPTPGGGTSNVAFFEITSPASPTFTSTGYTLPDPSTAQAVGDFNGDGKLDVATIVGVELGNGDGTFQALLPYHSTIIDANFLAADVNGDGKLDLVTRFNGVMLGNGDGTFQLAVPYPVGSGIASIVASAGDVNGDGKLDLVSLYPVSNGFQAQVLLGNGDGTFAPPIFSSMVTTQSSDYPAFQALGDFNGDGKLDLAFGFHDAAQNGHLGIMLGNGDGTFQSPMLENSSLQFPQLIVTADFNGDGKLDIALGSSGILGSGIEIFFGNGDGTFSAPTQITTTPLANLWAADVDGDGNMDLIGGNVDISGIAHFSVFLRAYP